MLSKAVRVVRTANTLRKFLAIGLTAREVALLPAPRRATAAAEEIGALAGGAVGAAIGAKATAFCPVVGGFVGGVAGERLGRRAGLRAYHLLKERRRERELSWATSPLIENWVDWTTPVDAPAGLALAA